AEASARGAVSPLPAPGSHRLGHPSVPPAPAPPSPRSDRTISAARSTCSGIGGQSMAGAKSARSPPITRGALRSLIAPLRAVLLPVPRPLAYSDGVIERLAAHDPRGRRLRTVPRIGPVTAAAFVATLDDVHRFRHAHQVEAYLGLVPRAFSSGD